MIAGRKREVSITTAEVSQRLFSIGGGVAKIEFK
jgi:hypothetical protein